MRGRGIQISQPASLVRPERPEFVPGDPSAQVRNKSTGKHLIERVHWPDGVQPNQYDACPIECQCGWVGTVGEWVGHRGSTDKDKERMDD